MKDLVAYDESGVVVAAAPAKAYPWCPIGPGLRLGEIGSDRQVRVMMYGTLPILWQVVAYPKRDMPKTIGRTPHIDAAIGIAQTWWDNSEGDGT